MIETKVLEVRCCCRPSNLIGYIEVAADLDCGDSIALPSGRVLPIEKFCRIQWLQDGSPQENYLTADRCVEQIYPAVKGEETPIVELCQHPRFREATERERDEDKFWYLSEDLRPLI